MSNIIRREMFYNQVKSCHIQRLLIFTVLKASTNNLYLRVCKWAFEFQVFVGLIPNKKEHENMKYANWLEPH